MPGLQNQRLLHCASLREEDSRVTVGSFMFTRAQRIATSFSSWRRRHPPCLGFNPLTREVGLKPVDGVRILFHDLKVVAIRASLALVLSLPILFALSLELTAQEREHLHSFQFRNVELRAALDSLLRWYAVPLIYLDKDVAGKQVNADCNDCGFEEALRKATEGQGLIWKRLGLPVPLYGIPKSGTGQAGLQAQ